LRGSSEPEKAGSNSVHSPLKAASQAYVATFFRQPELAKKNPKRIFLGSQDGGSFEKIFSNQLTAENFVNANRLAVSVEGLIRQFMTRKRRKDRVEDWKADYAALLGNDMVQEFSEVVDQVVPQSAVFLSALTFEEWVRLRGRSVSSLLDAVETGDLAFLKRLLLIILRYAKSQQTLTKSWPTLLKSQQFFDNAASYLKGLVEADRQGGGA
jgi:hypothetical protein